MASTSVPSTPTAGGTDSIDPADEAGGEVVYSSDGLLPLEVTSPPPEATPMQKKKKKKSKSDQDAAGGGDEDADDDEEYADGGYILDSAAMEASDAFEVFSGKVFSTSAVPTSSKRNTTTYATPSAKETPLQRLARLQREVAEVEAELTSTTTTTTTEGGAVEDALVQLASQLKSRLNEVSTARLPEQDELTRLIHKQLKQVGSSAATAATTEPEGTGVVYELYGTASNPTTTLDNRLTTVERLVGSSATSNKSLLSRLEELETLASGIDASALEHAATKAKVIRADLEAASKARTKLNSTATFTKKEDSKTIQQLHQQMTELEGLSTHLPVLTQRLQQLATLHVQSASFATRLSETERQASHVQASLSQLEQALETVQEKLVSNCQTVEQNVKQLDERLNQLK